MTTDLDVGDEAEFLDRFFSFEDALVRRVAVDMFARDEANQFASVDLETRERASGQWRLVRLTCQNYERFHFQGVRRDLRVVLSDGLHVARLEGQWVVDFDPGAEWTPAQLDESHMYVIADRVHYEVFDSY